MNPSRKRTNKSIACDIIIAYCVGNKMFLTRKFFELKVYYSRSVPVYFLYWVFPELTDYLIFKSYMC